MKGEVARLNTDFKFDRVRELFITAPDNVSPDNWAKAVEHVIGIEDRCREVHGFGDHVEAIIINRCGSADDNLSDIE
ncbi:hypothetical protein HPB48_026951 [Haemaphysalis longicornis]|uniref:Uncharacterized protein n=1 Tax=Haemaphysalis longicornis TaxID=44386 RepID=A0A9J6HD60_HAELO|nr:hypothetical protein HPB48_026951 [Haemaphysalis longicornis]